MSEEMRKLSFAEVVAQNERRFYYQIHKLGMNDPTQKFYQQGLFTTWHAYKKYQPNKGILSTFFNVTIRNRMNDLIKENIEQNRDEKMAMEKP